MIRNAATPSPAHSPSQGAPGSPQASPEGPSASHMRGTAAGRCRPVQRWSFFSTPLRTFLAVMLPIAALMAWLALHPAVPTGIRLTAGLVLACSVYAGWRGYLHRLEATPEAITYRTPLRRITIPWSQVRRIERYTPPDRNRLTQYVYITRLEQPPPDRHTIDDDTLQLQDRPGLLEALQTYWRASTGN